MPKSYYPPEPLKKIAIIPTTIFEKNAGKPIYRLTLAGYKSESRSFRDLITASAGYGLTSGSYASEKITLEANGTSLAQGNSDVAYTALFSVELFQRFYDNFASGGSRGVPSDKMATDFLRNECGIPDAQTAGVLEHIIQDARDWYLIQSIAGGERFVPVELAKKKLGTPSNFVPEDSTSQTENAVQLKGSERAVEPRHSRSVTDISPRLQLNIEIHIAPDTSDDKIEVIFKNMRKYLLSDGN
jgi:hypothetical protein